MPLYEYRCLKDGCGEINSAYRSVATRNETPACHLCGHDTKKIISAYHVHGDFEPYFDENLETHIKSKKHRQHVMKAQGVEEHFGQNWHTSDKKHRRVG